MKRSTVFLALAFMASSALEVSAARIRVRLALAGPATAVEAVLVAEPAANEHLLLADREAQRVSFNVTGPGVAPLTLPDTGITVWEVRAEAKGYWSRTAVAILAQTTEVDLKLWPTGAIQGKVAIGRAEQMPTEIGVSFFSPPFGPKGEIEGTVFCPVREGASWSCEVPEGTRDLKARARGFASHYFWAVEIDRREPRDLGTLSLRRGASIIGWALRRDSQRLPKGARVAATPAAYEVQDERLHLQGVEAAIGRDGFFSLEGLAPGRYRVVAHAEGLAPSAPLALSMTQDTETTIQEPLFLEPPTQLQVRVEPPLGPDSNPWILELVRSDRERGVKEHIASVEVPPTGWWEFTDLTPQTYRVVLSSGGGSTRWYSEEVEVTATSPPLEIKLVYVHVSGQLSLGDEPLSASLTFGGEFGTRRITAHANEEGVFSCFLPTAGDWYVDIEATNPPVQRRKHKTNVPETEPGETARMEIRLPKTRIRGKVVDSNGRPPSNSLVRTKGTVSGHDNTVVLDETAEFEIVGLEEGQVSVRGETRTAESEWQHLTIQTNVEPAPVTLVLRERREITGWVTYSGRGVPGAVVWVRDAHGGRPLHPDYKAVTEVDGSFTVKLPVHVAEALVLVEGPGFAWKLERVFLPEDVILDLQMRDDGGTLILESGSPVLPQDQDGDSSVYLFRDTAGIDVRAPYSWARRFGDVDPTTKALVIPNVEPGIYTACRGSLADYLLALAGVAPKGKCASGVLPPRGGEARLRLPE